MSTPNQPTSTTNGSGNTIDKIKTGTDIHLDNAKDVLKQSLDAAQPVADKILDNAHDAVANLSTLSKKAGDAICVGAEGFYDLQQRVTSDVRSTVKKNPLMSIGLAAIIGFALSRMMSRR